MNHLKLILNPNVLLVIFKVVLPKIDRINVALSLGKLILKFWEVTEHITNLVIFVFPPPLARVCIDYFIALKLLSMHADDLKFAHG